MMFSACCTTRSKAALSHGLFSKWLPFLLCCAALGSGAQQQVPSARVEDSSSSESTPSVQALIEQSVLTSKGKKPFLIVINFQVFDMKGAPSDEGTLTHWWGEVAGEATKVTSKELGEIDSLGIRPEQTPEIRRELYLLRGMLSAYIFPGAPLQGMTGEHTFKPVRQGQAELRCVNPTEGRKFADPRAKVCIDVQDNIRDTFTSDRETLYNHPAVFAGTRVALDVVQAMEGVQSISAHVKQLHSIDPAKVEVKLACIASSCPEKASVHVPGHVMAGRWISGVWPVYPFIAKAQHIGGNVLLLCTISKEGRVTFTTPLASPDVSLTKATLEALQTWRYMPWTLNGAPVELTTTITANFNPGPH